MDTVNGKKTEENMFAGLCIMLKKRALGAERIGFRLCEDIRVGMEFNRFPFFLLVSIKDSKIAYKLRNVTKISRFRDL